MDSHPSSAGLGVPLLPADSPPLLGVEARGGEVKHLYRCLANQPILLEAWTDFAWTLRGRCTTSRALRELLILRASQLAVSRYLWEDHVRFGKEAGLSDERIEQLSSWRESSLFDDQERIALEFTERIVVDGTVDNAVLAELQKRFKPDELVELVLTVSFYTMAPRVIDALRVPLMSTPPFSGPTIDGAL
jgi:alkylhydroperoxidase family enzyme